MLANDMTSMLNRLKHRMQLDVIYTKFPEELKMDKWIEIIENESMITFSRYFPNKVRFVVNDETCHRRREDGKIVYYIKDEYLKNIKLLGVEDIDWADTSSDNLGVAQTIGTGIYRPSLQNMESMFNSFAAQQTLADVSSLYNNNIYLEFIYPNKISITRVGNTGVVLSSFVVNLLVCHENIATISPTKMETFEALCLADIANWLYGDLKYFDNLETTYINVNLLLDQLQEYANSRRDVIEQLENSYVTAANDNIPYIITVNG